MTTATSLDQRLCHVVAAVFAVDPDSLTDESSPASIPAWDSLNHLNLVMALEAEFDLSLTPEDALAMQSVGHIRRLLGAQAGSEPASGVSFVDCRQEHLADVKRFIAESYGPTYVLGVNDAYFEWQYRAQPGHAVTARHGQGDYHLRLAILDGRIAGFLGYIPIELSIAGEIRRASWLANWMVHPDARHLGLGPLLAREVSRDFEVTLALGANAEARDILSRMGWTDFGMLKRHVAVLNPAEARRLTQDGQLDWPASCANHAAAPARGEVSRLPRFDDAVTAAWDRLYGARLEVAGTRRTAAYLNWRYADHCQFPYRLFAAYEAGQLAGFGVYRVEQARNLDVRVARILELAGAAPHQSALLAAMLRDASDAGAAAVDYFSGGPQASPLLESFGFLPGEHPAAAQIPVLYQPLDWRRAGIRFLADLQNVPEAAQVTEWHVSKADGDQDRPN